MKHHHISPLRFVSLLLNDDDLADGDPKPPLFFDLLQMVGDCRRCRMEILTYFELSSMEELEGLEVPALDLVRRREEVECNPILAWLDHLVASERVAAADDPTCLRPAVVEGLLARCRGRWSDLPREALADAHLATELAGRLSEDQDSFLADFDQPPLLARSWGARGNVLRILGDLPAAEWALAKAGELAGRPMAGKAVRAEVLSFQASLAIDRRQFEEARRPLEEAAKLYGGLADWHALGRVLLKTAKMELKLGRPLVGLQAVQRGESLLHPEREPVLRWVAAGIQLRLLCDLERFAEAERLLPRAKDLCAQYGGALEHSRVLWWEGRIESGLGRPSGAESAFGEVRQAFLSQGIGLDAALVTLDLAALYAVEARWGEIPPLAAEVVAVLRGLGIEREALAAMLLLAQANERQLAAGLLAEARQRLESNQRG